MLICIFFTHGKNDQYYNSGITYICKDFSLLSKNQRSSNQLDCVFCGAKRKPPSLLKLIANETKLEKLSLSPTEIPATLVGLAR